MRTLLIHLMRFAGAAALVGLAYLYHSVWLGMVAGACGLAVCEDAGRAALGSLRPSTRRERRMAARVESAVRQRQQANTHVSAAGQ